MRPAATCTPGLLAMIAKDWSASELRAMVAILIEELDGRQDDHPCDGTVARLMMRRDRDD